MAVNGFMPPDNPVPVTEDDQPELWRRWLPGVHRAIACPDAPVPLPAYVNCQDLESAQAYWECLEYLLTALVGWQDVGAGLAWWYGIGKDAQGDERLELVRRHWNDRGQLDFYAAHHWRGYFGCLSPEDLSPTDLSLGSRYRNLEWWRSFKSKDRTHRHDPFYGGSNPLHLGGSCHACWLTPDAKPTGYRTSASVETPSAVVIVNGFRHWRNDLASFSASLPKLTNRSWRFEVFDRKIGFLGLFRKSRKTGQLFQGRHCIHAAGQP